MKKKAKNFIINSIILTTFNIIFRILSIFFNGYISNKIGSETLGIYNLVMSIYTFSIILSNFGIDFSSMKLISEALEDKNYNLIYTISCKCIFFSGIIGIFTSLTLAFFSQTIIRFFLDNQIQSSVIYLMCIALPFISISSTIYNYFVAVRRVYKATISQFFEQIIKILITFILLNHFIQSGFKNICFALILGDLISEIIAFIINFILYFCDSKKYKTNYYEIHKNSFYYKKIFLIALPIAITSIIRTGISSIKQFIIPLSLSKNTYNYAQSLSIYGMINGMAFPIILFPSILFKSFSNLLIPELSGLSSQNNLDKIKKTIKVSFFTSTALSFFISSILFLFANKISLLIYHSTEIAAYIRILAPATIFIMLDGVIDNLLRGVNKQNNVMYINILDLILTTSLIYIVVPIYGIYGYIFCIYFSEIFNLVLSFIQILNFLS